MSWKLNLCACSQAQYFLEKRISGHAYFGDLDMYCQTVVEKGTTNTINLYCYSSVGEPTLRLYHFGKLCQFSKAKMVCERVIFSIVRTYVGRWMISCH